MTSNRPHKLPVSVVILTKNEEQVLPSALRSALPHFDEVIVLDSYSNDATTQIAERHGARVAQNSFEGYASQRNFALTRLQTRHKWIFFLDADEAITTDLVEELQTQMPTFSSRNVGMAYLRRKDYFMGRWIKRSSGYPTWFGRLCHSDYVRVEREINEVYQCSISTMQLTSHILHYPFAKGITNWLDRHNRYSTSEAQLLFRHALDSQPRPGQCADAGNRRQRAKRLYMRLPARPLLSFIYLYFVRLGILDGHAGLRYALLRSFYELLINIKRDELLELNRP